VYCVQKEEVLSEEWDQLRHMFVFVVTVISVSTADYLVVLFLVSISTCLCFVA